MGRRYPSPDLAVGRRLPSQAARPAGRGADCREITRIANVGRGIS